MSAIADWSHVDKELVLSIITAGSNFGLAMLSNEDKQGLMQSRRARAERLYV
jgi:hypothetical protein